MILKGIMKTNEEMNVDSFRKIINDKYRFEMKIKKQQMNNFAYLKRFILQCPHFEMNYKEEESKNIKEQESKDINEEILSKIPFNDNDEVIFRDPGALFDFAVQNESIRNLFIDAIKDIIQYIETILNDPPYYILFGRINLSERNQKLNENKVFSLSNIDNAFYEGFGIPFNE